MDKKFFLYKIPLSNWQLSLLKISSASFGIIIGCCFADYLKPVLPLFFVIGVLTGVWIGFIWFKTMSIVKKIIS
jgi:hypothetical protein